MLRCSRSIRRYCGINMSMLRRSESAVKMPAIIGSKIRSCSSRPKRRETKARRLSSSTPSGRRPTSGSQARRTSPGQLNSGELTSGHIRDGPISPSPAGRRTGRP